jgi:hypothetical protein
MIRILLLLTVLPAAISAQITQPIAFNGRVKLEVQSPTETLETLVSSYVSRELRALKDVAIVNQEPDWILKVSVLAVENNGNRKVGNVLSFILLQHVDASILTTLFKPETAEAGTFMLRNTARFLNNWLLAVNDDDLKKACEDIVALID